MKEFEDVIQNEYRPPSKGYLELQLELLNRGVQIRDEDYAALVRAEMIKSGSTPEEDSLSKVRRNFSFKTDAELESEKFIRKKIRQKIVPKDIRTPDWKPDHFSELYDEPEFIAWINSIIFHGFANKIDYWRYDFYIKQSERWCDQNLQWSECRTDQKKDAFLREEIPRCKDNSLYFLNRYLDLIDSDEEGIPKKYTAVEAQQIICFLFDLGFSMLIGKGRQIGATTTLGGLALKKIMFTKNLFLKFITETDAKGKEIFDYKIKQAFNRMPEFFKMEVANDSMKDFRFGRPEFITMANGKKRRRKGSRGGSESRISVVAPTETAINGGSPGCILIDEAGLIPMLSRMMAEARPTMFARSPKTGRLVVKRQIVAWGTGGDMDKGGKSYEQEFMTAIKEWREGNYDYGFIPLFFDWTAKPGADLEFYESEKKVYYSKTGSEQEVFRTKFHQHYPNTLEDMFLTSHKTIVSQDVIQAHIHRIMRLPHEVKPQHGYFEPVYDKSKPQPEESDVPYKIVGATFVATDPSDPRACVVKFLDPNNNWTRRYFQGTDPVNSQSGPSDFASAIFDKYYNTISCVVAFRSADYNQMFLQSYLMGIYYDTSDQIEKKGVKELGEANSILMYEDYLKRKGAWGRMVHGSELPDYFQVNSPVKVIGLDSHGIRSTRVIEHMMQLMSHYGDRINIPKFWDQTKNFVRKETRAGNFTWEAIDKRYFQDDVLFACTYAYICSLTYPGYIPKEKTNSKIQGPSFIQHTYVRDSKGELSLGTTGKKMRPLSERMKDA